MQAMKNSPSRKAFLVFNTIFFCLVLFLCLFPIWYVAIQSLSDSYKAINAVFWPIGFTFQNYVELFSMPDIFQALAGQTLKFTGPKTGCRAYIAFAGGLDIPVVMGSRSTYMKAKIGGLNGRKLEKDDVIAFRAPKTELKNMTDRSLYPEFVPRKEYTVRVVLGPQDDAFTDAGIQTFLSEVYTVTPEFDRMGCRLEGAAVAHKEGGDIISDGIAFGAIQIPSAGKPIIMLADRQTTGGYTKIANVITADFRIIGQLKAGDKVRFEKVSVAQAQDALLTQRTALNWLRKSMNR